MAETQSRFRTGRIAGAATATAVAVFAVLYVSLAEEGNRGAAACEGAEARAAALDPLIGGEVAAFQVAETPQLLSDLTFTGAEGQPRSLADFSGQVTLLNLWATWCAPCRREMPALDRLQAAQGGAAFAVVPVSIDTGGRERPAEFLASIGVENLPLYTDSSTEIFNELKQRGLAVGLPVTVLVDENGCHLGHMNGPAEWDSAEGQRLIEAAVGAPP